MKSLNSYRHQPYQPITTLQAQLNKQKEVNIQLNHENKRLQEEVQLLKDEINNLLACCSLEKKVDYMLKNWLDTEIVGNEEIDRQAFSIKMVDFIKKELQKK
ncbi:hypothetical protein ACFOZ1_06690 [Gracilibacillus marinus]|uniref:Uncharacterized protein n=1 Tax=Gracilibacillus marinus TaxID=630535 RepID=A0ABV8VUW8_9BACI